MTWLLVAILCVLFYICMILRTIARNQVASAIHNEKVNDALVREIRKVGK